MKTLFYTLISLAFVATLFLGAPPAFAGPLDEIRDGIVPQCDWVAGETYGLGAFTLLAVNAFKLIWGILGSLALVMFIWGGFLWLTARGEEQQVKQGWDTLINAVIGLVIVLGSWVIINTIVLAFTSPGEWKVAQVFNNEAWHKLVEKDPVCIRVAAHKKGFVSPLPSGGSPIVSAPVPGQGLAAGEPVYQTSAAFSFGRELEVWPVTAGQGGSIPIGEGGSLEGVPLPSNDPTLGRAIDFVISPNVLASVALAPLGGPLVSMGGKFVISGVRIIGSKVSFAGAKVGVQGCTRAATFCQAKAQEAVTRFMNVRAEELQTIIRYMHPQPQSIPIPVRP